MTDSGTHPPGRRKLRSAVREDGYETWTIDQKKYDILRDLILRCLEDMDEGDGVYLQTLIKVAEDELTGHTLFESGRFTNWIRFGKVDLEVEGVVSRVEKSSPQRVKLVE